MLKASMQPHLLKHKTFGKLLTVLLLLLFILLSTGLKQAVNAESVDDSIEQQLDDSVGEQLGNLDIGGFDDFLSGLGGDAYNLFGSTTFYEKLQSVLSGQFSEGYNNFFMALLGLIGGEVLNFLPLFASITIVALLLGMLGNMKPGFLSKGMGEIIYFVCYSVMILLMMTGIVQIMVLAHSTMDSMKTQMNLIFPILLTLMAGLGGVVSVQVYQPAVAILSSVVLNIITSVIFPLFIITCVLSVVSNLSTTIKLDRLVGALKSISNWIIGIIFTVFLAFLSIQGITAGVHDGISIRAAKYAVSNSIPVLGGYIKDGFDLVLSSTMLIKNALGVTGLTLLLASVAVPFVKILLFMLGLKLTSAIIEPITDSRISGFVFSVSKHLSMVTVSIVGTAFMYFITVMLLICSSNIV